MSTFDPDAFMTTQYVEANDTKLTPIPPDEYQGQIVDVKVRKIEVQGEERGIIELNWEVIDQRAKDATGLSSPRARQSIWLDTTDQGSLDMGKGKNVQLGKLRDAVGQNKPGKSWSPNMLLQQTAWIKVENEDDKRDPEVKYNRVKAVAAARSA